MATETIDFAAERERLREEMAETTDEQATIALEDEAGVASDYLAQLQQRGTALERYRDILNGWVSEEWAVEEITIRELTFGDTLFLEDLIDNNPKVDYTPAFVAIGTADAPYLEHDPDSYKRNADAVLETVANVNDLPIPMVRWLEERIGDISHLGDDMGNEYTDLLLGTLTEKMAEADGSG